MPIFSEIEEGRAENESLKMKRAIWNVLPSKRFLTTVDSTNHTHRPHHHHQQLLNTYMNFI
jgi:hypothetical protein